MEVGDLRLSAQLFVNLGEAHVGIAGHVSAPQSEVQASNMSTALSHIQRGYEGLC